MSTVKRDMLTTVGEWRKHLRPYGKREFWSGERQAGKREAGRQILDENDPRDDYWLQNADWWEDPWMDEFYRRVEPDGTAGSS